MSNPEQLPKYTWPSGEVEPLLPETQLLLDQLIEDPTTPFMCVHDHGSPAVVLCDVPEGCAALPGIQAQPLCEQHYTSDGSFEGMAVVADLSINGGLRELLGIRPLFIIEEDPSDGSLAVVQLEY